MRPFFGFIRSVLPADLSQLLYLLGVVFLSISPHLRWWPADAVISLERTRNTFANNSANAGALLLYPLIFAGAAGYFIAFWPGKKPVQRILGYIYLPAAIGLCLMAARYLYLTNPAYSILENTDAFSVHNLSRISLLPWKLLPGFHLCALGLLLIGVYCSRLIFRMGSLPLSLPNGPGSTSSDSESWKRLQFLIWFLVGPFYLVQGLLTLLTLRIPTIFSSHLSFYVDSAWFLPVASFFSSVVGLAITLSILGKDGGAVVRSSLRLPEPSYASLAIAIPIGIGIVLSTGQYLFDRAYWAAHYFGKFGSPEFISYMSVPSPRLFYLLFAAAFEEVIFRGLLQPRFVRRYGIYRGIFLAGIVWAVFHFPMDFSFGRFTDDGVIPDLAYRILSCVVLSFALGWLMQRTGSILPSTLAHAFYNLLIFSNFGPPFLGKETVRMLLWAVLSCALYYYWPVRFEEDPETSSLIPNAERAS